ncbi:alkaline phosphatase family protein [Thiohalobacter sp. IOR34]|uniref:alkaline phosphatase family protein n=1 Tax=Thiohalobacter sp. IOR34 TaxID=3057176 RepID=UPI0025AF17D1|nr:alkaline phosphatase family protein [Thiohalobacter sp. IOR34]WJW74976.1 alkaline phosphatase family protein [Thiohalobacter sp. IOR34]
MQGPDYRGSSIVNLMSSIRVGLGLDAGLYPQLECLPGRELQDCRNLVLLVIDGLGFNHLRQAHPHSRLAAGLRVALSSVFPSTTASAVTSLFTGVGPQQHAISGWFMWLRELGMVTSILPFRSRAGGLDLAAAGFEPGRLLGAPPLFDRLPVDSAIITEAWIADSPFSRATAGRTPRIGYQQPAVLFERLLQRLHGGRGRQFTYAYWSEFDAMAHREGVASRACAELLTEFDRLFAEFLAACAGSDTRVLVVADHGFIDSGPAHYLLLEDHPQLAECLALPLCGEPRAAYCYVRPGREAAFERYVADVLDSYCELRRAEDLIERGWFGLGEPHPQLARRVGDYVLLMKGRHVIKDYLSGEKPFFFTGVHSGLSEDEMRVPLIVADA